ncbi:predicted protein [Naegleria gruberi]|uniref:Predicted protein n=1 Tax=Naegleria gruberi TaxID=5762 RepID=D2W4N9_NAEGR|nr:uncharacterized protein NAEGRDRAFT_54650 [Naegleria gruberi]EFC35964.1 predicted protein [Naegleria gruberi]|eukprot:XP_002668708.1 predicted protein [Naegleria gruberi strain NEG-M]
MSNKQSSSYDTSPQSFSSYSNLIDLLPSVSQVPSWTCTQDQPDNTPSKKKDEKTPGKKKEEKPKKLKKGTKRKFENVEEAIRDQLTMKNVKFLKEFLKSEFGETGGNLRKDALVAKLVTRICSSVEEETDERDESFEDNIKKKALLIVERNQETYNESQAKKAKLVNLEETEKKENPDDKIVLIGFKNKRKVGYVQKTREEQIKLVEKYKEQYSTPDRGSQQEFAKQNNISPSQFSRYLSACKRNELTLKVERGHPPPLLLKDQILQVIDITRKERSEKKQVSNIRLGEIMKEVAGLKKTPSVDYISKFSKKFLYKRKIKTTITKRERIETAYEQLYRTYYYYCFYAAIMFRNLKSIDRSKIVVFDETGTNTKATERTNTPIKDDDAVVLQLADDIKDTFLVAVTAEGGVLPVSIVESVPGKKSTINGNKVTVEEKIAGVHIEHIEQWVEKVYIPNSKEGDILLWDNLSHHKCKSVQKILKQHNRINILLPVGGHHQSPLDNMCFRYAKRELADWKKNNSNSDRKSRNAAFEQIISNMNPDVIVNSFRKCLMDIWNYDSEEEYLKYVRASLKMNNDLYDLYIREFNPMCIGQFYVELPTPSVKVETDEKLDQDPILDDVNNPWIDSDSMKENFDQKQVEQISKIILHIQNKTEFNYNIQQNAANLQLYVLSTETIACSITLSTEALETIKDDTVFLPGNTFDIFGICFSKISSQYLQYIPSDFSQRVTNQSKKFIETNLPKSMKFTSKGFIIFPVARSLHWYLLIYDCQSTDWFLFDSFAKDFSVIESETSELFEMLPSFIVKPKTVRKTLQKKIQVDGNHCGDYCVLLMDFLSAGFSLSDAVDIMTKPFSISNYRAILVARLQHLHVVEFEPQSPLSESEGFQSEPKKSSKIELGDYDEELDELFNESWEDSIFGKKIQ